MANNNQKTAKMLKTKTTSPIGDDEVGTLESKEKAGKSFFSKKNILIMAIAFVLSLTLIGLTISFYMKINFNDLFQKMGIGLGKDLGWLWLTLLIVVFFMSVVLSGFVPYWVKVRKFLKIKMWKWWTFGFIINFLKAATPANFIYDPYTVFWLKTQGVSTSRATSLMFTNSLLWQMVQAFVTFPSFVIVMVFNNGALLSGGWEGQLTFAGMIIGMTVDFFGVALMALLCMSKTIHYRISVIFNWFKKKMHMKYHTKPEIVEKYKTKAVIKADFIGYLKDWKNTLFGLICYIAFELILYFSLYWAMCYINVDNVQLDFGAAFNSANICFTANRINVLPGGILGLEIILKTLLISTNAIPKDYNSDKAVAFANDSILIWKTFGTYIPATIGLLCMVGITTSQIVHYKKTKHGFVDVKFDR